MKQLINSKIMQIISVLLVFIAIAKFISMIMLIWLPKSGVEVPLNAVSDIKYRNYQVANSFGLANDKKIKPSQEILKIDNFDLHALYGNDERGFIVFTQKNAPLKTHILAINKTFKGYRLVHIEQTHVILEKNGKAYRLVPEINPQARLKAPVRIHEEVVQKEISHSSESFNEIWKHIALDEIKKGSTVTGFKVMSVNQNSVFNNLGLQIGDAIVSINGQPLRNYEDVYSVYNSSKDYKVLKVIVIRKGKEKELKYEIN